MIDALKRMVIAACDPRYEDKARELRNLRVAAAQNGSYVQPGTFYRLLSADGGLAGFSFTCCQTYQLRSADLWLRVHICPHCRTRISVLEAAGIRPGDNPETWPEKFMAFPVQPSASKQAEVFQDTWVGANEVGYEMTDPFAASKQGGN